MLLSMGSQRVRQDLATEQQQSGLSAVRLRPCLLQGPRALGTWACSYSESTQRGDFLVVQSLRLCTSTAGDAGSIPGLRTKILHASQYSQDK